MTWIQYALSALIFVLTNALFYSFGRCRGTEDTIKEWEKSNASLFTAWRVSLKRVHDAWNASTTQILSRWNPVEVEDLSREAQIELYNRCVVALAAITREDVQSIPSSFDLTHLELDRGEEE